MKDHGLCGTSQVPRKMGGVSLCLFLLDMRLTPNEVRPPGKKKQTNAGDPDHSRLEGSVYFLLCLALGFGGPPGGQTVSLEGKPPGGQRRRRKKPSGQALNGLSWKEQPGLSPKKQVSMG